MEHQLDQLVALVQELQKLPKENEWVEFKLNDHPHEEIGEYISALANSAALVGEPFAYVVWGIDDSSHGVAGTTFYPSKEKVGNEELENWLLRHLAPKLPFSFSEVEIDGKHVVLLQLAQAFRHPVRFKNHRFIRVGSYKKPLHDFPEKERELWRVLDETPFEDCVAMDGLTADRVLEAIDYPSYFHLMNVPLPASKSGILRALESDELIKKARSRWMVTNLGAVLFARQLSEFRSVRRKAVRVIVYKGSNRIETVREQEGGRGYASGFEGLITYVNNLLPSNEVLGAALRRTVPVFPELAIRELVVNALIHQDLAIDGAGPMIEIFADRMEITNPGEPLVATNRFLDTPPKSRNESLASLMRRMGICEERGSGIDKVVLQTEVHQLPAPLFEAPQDSTRVVLFAPRPLARMGKTDRVRACYLHACLKYVGREFLTNSSVRERFGIQAQNAATASRLIKEAVEAGQIAPHDPNTGPKYMKYVPWWAADPSTPAT